VERRFDAAAIRSILERLSQPAPAIETFVLSTLFDLAIGNTDNHAKNHAVLYEPDGSLVLAPLYDLLPIQLHARHTDRLAFNLGGAERFADMTADDLFAFLKIFGIEGGRSKRIVDGPVREMLATLEERSALLPEAGLKTFDDLIGRELDSLSEMLGLGLELRERDYIGTRGGGWLSGS
jgi:serine/threonine-protein kinase HipA